MFLSKLTIQGFKSFSDRTELNFSEGVTSIVGPNGCGKTNIVDALRWVLGEQKSSVLRSNKMEDVIFNGTQKIKPLGFCEAVITIENNRGLLPTEYNTIEICRRYYRSGESEYYINKTPCRLKDVHNMFIDTGMSSGAYSVIELKMIESILSQNPTDRRTMFDEASGINNYNKQRAASIRRLINTKSDMERINDIMLEVEANVKNLRLQMKRYDRHTLLSSQLISCEYLFHKKNLDIIKKDLDPMKKIFSSKIKSKNIFYEELEKKEEFLDSIQKKFEKTKMGMEKIQSKTRRQEEEIVSANQKIIISTEQVGHSKNRIDHFKNEISDKKHLIKALKDEIKKMEKSLSQIIPEVKKKEKEFKQLEEKLLKFNFNLKNLESEDLIKRQRLNENINKTIAVKNLIETNKKIIIEKESSTSRINKDINVNLEKDIDSSKNLKKILGNLDKVKEKNSIKIKEINKLKERSQIIERESADLLNIKYKNEANLKQLKSKFDFYRKIMISKEGSCNGNDYIIKNINKYKNVIGKVSELLDVPKHLTNAVSMCLGKVSDFLVIKTLSDAKSIISSIPKDMSLNFIILDRISKEKSNKITKSHLIYNLRYKNNLKPLYLHFLSDFVLVDRLEDIKDMNNSYITLEGDMFTASGSYQLKPNKNESSMFIKSELDKIRDFIAKQKKEISLNNQKIKSINKEKEKNESNIISLNIDVENNSKNINELLVMVEHAKFISSELQHQNKSNRNLIEKIEKEIINMKIENKNKVLELKSNNLNSNSINKSIELLANKMHDKKNIILELRQRMQSKNIKLVEFRNKTKGLKDRINDYKANFENINGDMNRYSDEIIKLQDLVKKLNLSVLDSKKMINKLYADQKKLNISEKKLHSQYTDEYKIFQEYQSEIKDKRVMKDENIEEMNKLELAIGQLKGKDDYHSELLSEIDKDSLSNLHLEKFKNLTATKINEKIEDIRKSIDRIGAINMDVNSQHKAEIERFDFLTNQYNDLVKAEDSLQETINKLDAEAKKMFLDTFKEINKNFKKTYNMFYKDAKANLELKGDNVLQSEIIIKATPPGKSTQSLRMLSGGEKAITAIALLFAIYLVKPSPFCILDEVDAPLDDTNILRFNNVLKEFSKNTQFIVVTHNKLTMENSDYLYGVTQQRKGISKIVSVNLVDIDKKKIA